MAAAPGAPAGGLLYFVNTTSDTVVVGACANGDAGCSLRGAIQAANSHPGADGIEINLPAGSVINLTQALPTLNEATTISGPGSNFVTVRRDTGGDYRVFNVAAAKGMVVFSGITISNGNDPGSGGGIGNTNAGTLKVMNCTISGNATTGAAGGGIYTNTGPLIIENSAVVGNSAFDKGGGIAGVSGPITITNCTIDGNQTLPTGVAQGGGAGGGVNSSGSLNITNSTISNNSTQLKGGGIHSGFTIITGSTINSNVCTSQSGAVGGGGLYSGAGVTITNSTIANNSVAAPGGGINTPGGNLDLFNSTVTGNVASQGGGISSGDIGSRVKNTLVALNNANLGPDAAGDWESAGFNLIGKADGSTGFGAPTDQLGTVASPLDPQLDPAGLRDNGGPTRTIALRFGSPAIDKASSQPIVGTLTTDQRGVGFARTFDDPGIANAAGGDGTDIGAFEVQTAEPTTLGNISTRLRVETGDNALIGGFIITGTQPKKIIVRAIGPSLSVGGALADPVLELRNSSGGLILSNNNWRDDPAQEAEIIATTIPPSNNLESAIVATLPADNSAYTAIVRGANNGTGIGLVEAYDLDRTVNSKLGNISTRGLVQTGDNALIGGLIVLGQASLRVIVRAIGPSLPVAGALGDPVLELRDGNGALITANDNWRNGGQEAEIIATTIPPSNDLESAIVRSLTPGNYTAVVRGVGGTTGVAVVEAYGLN